MPVDRQSLRAWGDAEIYRFQFRAWLFERRGCSPAEAEALADRLAARDQLRDDRRLCLECEFFAERGAGCAARTHYFVRDVLQRCPRFEFARPSN
jgi:hypothetical protein